MFISRGKQAGAERALQIYVCVPDRPVSDGDIEGLHKPVW